MKPPIPSLGTRQRARIATAAPEFCAALLLLAACASNDGDATQVTADLPGVTPEAIGTAREALFGSDACKDVFITIYNQLDWPVTVTKVEYDNLSEGRWQSEGLANKVVWPGSAYERWTENLERSENDRIGDFRVYYDDYYGSHTAYNNESTVTCLANASFVLDVK